ncbi:DNA polymerase theta [Daphnia magna]|uniref:DNA polymerase theta n=1 Tax=Daphnia magna TaxID=35525 RepID=A0A162T435_9CRUS|nr:DNA polymerase theta [Daphnia magna]
MSIDLSWGASIGSQVLAEISLLEANAKCMEDRECSPSLSTNNTSILANSNLSSSMSETSAVKTKPILNLSHSSSNRLSNDTNVSCLTSVTGLLGSNPSEMKTGTSSNMEHRTNSLSVSIHSPLSCSTPVANSAASLRRASLRSSSVLKLQLQNWGLPSAVVQKYAEKKITTLFPWQVECLQTGKVLSGSNLIYSAPTSSGKTLVSELLMLKTIIDLKKKAIYILPFVAVAREKTRFLKYVTEDIGIRVESFAGSSSPPGGLKNCDLAICTIEKANSLINRLIEDGSLDQLGIVVVDELHLIGDSHRGFLLELLLTKIFYATSRNGNRSRIQLVGMSATLPSLEVLAKWLRADLYRTDFRPIALKEHIKIGIDIFHPDFRLARKIDPNRLVPNDIEHLIYLCLETMLDGHSVLIFCPTKNWCEKMAQNISTEFFNLGSSTTSHYGIILRQQLKGDLLAQVLERLKATPAGLDAVLGQTIRFGVAFHHAGLTSEERENIETAFRHGVIRVLVATSTLSSGVNLPARRVIIRTPMFHGTVIDPLVYRQMIGRAGRFGVDTDGDSYLICQPSEKHQVQRMFNAVPPALKSCLLLDSTSATDPSMAVTSSMKRAMLEVIATGSASTEDDLKLYASCTLLAVLNDVPDVAIQACVAWLVSNEFIRRQTVEDGKERLTPTQLGLACLASSLSPDESLNLLNELKTARRGLILDSDLHLVYQITPTYVSDQMTQIDWLHYLTLWEELSESQKRVGEAVGVEERFLVRAMKGTVTTTAPRQSRQMAIHRRFYTALALHELMNEVRLAVVARTYKMNKGTLQSLQQQTATFAGMVTIFCHRLGWNTLYVLLEHFQSRLLFGVQLELCDLMRLPSMLSHTARLLYDAGLTNVSAVATAAAENIEVLLKNACPFKSAKETEEAKKLGETDVNAHNLVAEARKLLQLELGVKIQWSDKVKSEPALPKPSQEKFKRPSLVPKDFPSPIGKNTSIKLSCTNSPLASTPIFEVTPIPQKTVTPPVKTKSAMKENVKPADITPDMFAESSVNSSHSFAVETLQQSPTNQAVIQILPRTPLTKAAGVLESLRLSDDELFDTIRTPPFVACAEKLAPVTEKPLEKYLKRRVSTDDISFLDATPPPHQSIGKLANKKSKISTTLASPLQPHSICQSPLVLSFSSDDSSIIPSSLPVPKFKINEITTSSRVELFIKETMRQNCLAIMVYKEKNSILGLAVAWSCLNVNYIQLRERFDSSLDVAKVSKLKSLFEALIRLKVEFIVYDIRSTTGDLRSLFHHLINEMLFRDVDLCQWLLEPSNPSVSLQKLVRMYGQQGSPTKTYRGREKVLHECCSLLDIFHQMKQRLHQNELLQSLIELEMPLVMLMLQMEEMGIAFDRSSCESVLQTLREHLKMLEETAHRLAGRQFSLSSSKEVSKVISSLNLCIEEKNPQSFINPLKKKYQPPSTTKTSLVKLGRIHPLPKLIVEFRKVSAIVQTIICPLLQASTFHVDGIERIAGECEFRNVTGRVNIVQPNLQHIPRPFPLSDGRLINVRTAFYAVPAQAERQAVNTKIQGSAADLVKTAVILLNRSLNEKLADVHLVHQIHDELLFQVPVKSMERAARVVRHCMETAIPMKIRLPVAIKTGKTWGTMEPYKS